jgi:hypothetical protein
MSLRIALAPKMPVAPQLDERPSGIAECEKRSTSTTLLYDGAVGGGRVVDADQRL